MIASKKIIKNAVDFIQEKLSPDKIYLFGSYANGNPTENSDLDFMIIKETTLPKYKRALALYTLDKTRRIGIPIGIDFLVYTPQEYENGKNEINSVAGEVSRTGKLLYAKE